MDVRKVIFLAAALVVAVAAAFMLLSNPSEELGGPQSGSGPQAGPPEPQAEAPSEPQGGSQPSEPQGGSQPSAGCASNPNPVFTAAFTNLSAIQALQPLGSIYGGSPGRAYITIKEGMRATVYSPTDAVLENIIYADRGGGFGEYGLRFRVSCEVTYLLDHIHNVSDKIRALAPQTVSKSSATQFGTDPNVPVKAGELLGYTKGTSQARTFDFVLFNSAKKPSYINPARWTWDQDFADCPYDYFAEPLKSQYYALLGMPNGDGITKSEGCGSPSHDVPGTASGGWFQGNGTDWTGDYLAIATDPVSVNIIVRKDREITLRVIDYESSDDPAGITVGETACYDDPYTNTWAFIKLLSESELAMATGDGTCPAGFPQTQAQSWQR
jgi:hypothetical protein